MRKKQSVEKPSTPNDSHVQAVSKLPHIRNNNNKDKFDRLFELVPPIGTRWRWFDIPYRFIDFFLRSRFRHLIPSSGRRLLVRGINFFMAFEQHARNKIEVSDDPRINLIIPEHARLRQGGIWTVELFPPSHYEALERSLNKNGWNRSPFSRFDEPNEKQVKRARAGRRFAWARMGAVAQSNTNYIFPDAKREDLPVEFEHIELTAVQLGTSVTALVAFFHLSKKGESSLNQIWKRKHQPTLTLQGFHRPKVTNRYFAAIEATQRERMRIHDLARAWLSGQCPGFFASRSDAHPVLDLNLFDGINPAEEEDCQATKEALRALGIDTRDVYRYVSPQIKGAALIPYHARGGPHEPLRNCWAIAGEYQKTAFENKRSNPGNNLPSPGELGYIFNHAAGTFTLYLAITAYLSEQRAIYSTSRDLASTRHQRFTVRRARRLSVELLKSGLDLPAVARDSKTLWDNHWILRNNINVKAIPLESHREHFEPFDLIESFGKGNDTGFQELLKEDEFYRNAPSTAAALGASADAAATGKLALIVAAGSMIVATITLLITEPSQASLWPELIKYLRGD